MFFFCLLQPGHRSCEHREYMSQPLCFSSVHSIRCITGYWGCNDEGVRVALRWRMQVWAASWKPAKGPWNIMRESMSTFNGYLNWPKVCTCTFLSLDSGVPGFFEWGFFFFFFWPLRSMRDLSSLTREPVPSAVEVRSPNRWTTREVPWVRLVNRSWLTASPLCPCLSPSLDFDSHEWEIPSCSSLCVLLHPNTGPCTQ